MIAVLCLAAFFVIREFPLQLVSQDVTYILCAIIGLIFIRAAYKYWTLTGGLLDKLQTAIDVLEANSLSPATWEAVNNKFEDNSLIAGPWKRFVRESRVTADSWIQGEDGLIAVNSPRAYLNEDSLYLANVNAGLYAAIPGILTGAGLLFTFTGLSAGISLGSQGLASTHLDLSLLLETLTNLLSGAGQAFLTSLVGLLLSLLFVFGSNHRHNALLVSIEKLNEKIEDGITVLYAEALQYESGKLLVDQGKKMTSLTDDVKLKLDTLFTKLLDGIKAENEAEAAARNKAQIEIVQAIKSIEAGISSMSENQVKQIEGVMNEAVSKLSDIVESQLHAISAGLTDSANAISAASAEFKNAFLSINQKVAGAVEATKQHVTEMEKAFDLASTEIENRVGALKEVLDASANRLDEMAKELQTNGVSFGDALKASADAAKSSLTAGQEAIEGAAGKAAESFATIGQAGDAFAATINQAGVDFSNSSDDAGKRFGDHVDKAAESITGLMGRLESGQKAMVGNLGALLDALRNYQNTIDETSRLFAEAQSFEESIKKAAALVASSAETNAGTLQKTSAELGERLKETLENVAESSAGITEQQQAIQSSLSNMITNAEKIQEITMTHFSNITQQLDVVHQGLKKHLETADSQLANAVSSMSSGLDQWIESQDAASDKMLKTARGFNGLYGNLDEVLTDMNKQLEVMKGAMRDQFALLTSYKKELSELSKTASSLRNTQAVASGSSNAAGGN